MTRRVLLISTYFPPDAGAGVVRIASFMTYLKEVGWAPFAIHPLRPPGHRTDRSVGHVARGEHASIPGYHWSNATVDRLAQRLQWRLRHRTLSAGFFPHRFRSNALKVARAEHRRRPFDAVLVSTPDPSALRVGAAAGKALNVPWVADFRDVSDEILGGLALRLAVAIERPVVRSAAALVTVSDGLRAILSQRYDIPVHVVFNGFPELAPERGAGVRDSRFTLRYTGSLGFETTPAPVLEAVDALVAEGAVAPDDIRVEFYGAPERVVGPAIARMTRPDLVAQFARRPFGDIQELQRTATALLLLTNFARPIPGILSTKVFEYLGALRPILSVPCYGAVDALLAETRAGTSVAPGGDLREHLRSMYATWRTQRYLPFDGDRTAIQAYSRQAQARRLGEVLDGVAASYRR